MTMMSHVGRSGAAQNDYKCSLIDDENLKCLCEISSNFSVCPHADYFM